MREKLLQLFEELNAENQAQVLDYALMLWEMEQGEKQLSENFGLTIKSEEQLKKITAEQFLKDVDKKDIN